MTASRQADLDALAASPIRFEPFDVSCRDRLFDTYARLHREAPVRRCDSGFFTVVRLDDVRTMYSRTDLFSNRPNGSETMRPDVDLDDADMAAALGPVFGAMLLDTAELLSSTAIVGADPPLHTRLRGSVNRAFTRGRIAALRGYIDEEVARCLLPIATADTFEVNKELAGVIPLRVMTRLFGLPASDDARFRAWAYDLAAQLNAEETRGSPGWVVAHYQLISGFADYFVPLIEQRKATPGADLLSDIVADEKDTLSASEAVLFVLTLLGAGIETTSNLIGNVVAQLLRNPDQLALVQDDPTLIGPAIEESLRFDSPFQFTFREAKVDVELSGVTIPAGSPILNMLGAANRDPAHFTDPDRFDVRRKAAHVGFGHGIHFCLGAALARTEAHAALAGLLPHLGRFEIDEAGVVSRSSLLIWGHERLPLRRVCG